MFSSQSSAARFLPALFKRLELGLGAATEGVVFAKKDPVR